MSLNNKPKQRRSNQLSFKTFHSNKTETEFNPKEVKQNKIYTMRICERKSSVTANGLSEQK